MPIEAELGQERAKNFTFILGSVSELEIADLLSDNRLSIGPTEVMVEVGQKLTVSCQEVSY